MEELIRADVLIIGSGIAGLTAALKLLEAGFQVVMIAKGNFQESSTNYAQGGIVFKGKEDSEKLLVEDILKAGAGASNKSAAKILASEGPKLVESILIKKLNVPFTRDNKNNLHLTEEGAHSLKRIIHAEDTTGKAIEESFIKYLQERSFKNFRIFKNHIAIDLLTLQHHCRNPLNVYKAPECLGVYAYSINERIVKRFIAKVTILATGGIGQVFYHTTNPDNTTGDGLAMAYRAGIPLINMEYVQFHPTTLYHKNSKRFLISEAVRGEGGVLKTPDNRTFMEKYHPLKSLAPRDIVSRAIHEEMSEHGYKCVFLDIASYLSSDKIKKRFPNIYKTCLSYGIDITEQPIPVVPAVHFLCGGIKVNLFSETVMKRLYAVGEVACTGLHGANRLASTSLLEGLVFAYRAAERIINKWKLFNTKFPEPEPWIDTSEFDPDPALIAQDWSSVKHIMWNYVGLVRTEKRLKRAIYDLRHLWWEAEEFYKKARLTKSLIELRNGILVGLIIARAAYVNRESRGCHFRKDSQQW